MVTGLSRLVAALLVTGCLLGSAHPLTPAPEPLIECPDTHAHVWKKEQCDTFEIGRSTNRGDRAPCRGLLCSIPGLGGVLGGLPGLGSIL